MLRTLVTYGFLSVFIAGSAVAQQFPLNQQPTAKLKMSQASDPNKCVPQCDSAFHACTQGCVASSPLVQRFLGSNHIMRPRRVCRTMCG
jgi:hypothetical protein